jgi:hypothetical protein
MATHRLIIDSSEPGPFSLQIDRDTVTVGGPGVEAPRVLESLHVVRVHCVLDVETDGVSVRGEDEGPQALAPGGAQDVGGCRIRLQGSALGATAPAKPAARSRKRLVAIAGPDEGREFALPDSGVVTFGKDRHLVDIVLRGLRVQNLHCRLRLDGDVVEVIDEGKMGTQLNGKRVTRQEMKSGDVLKIDNNQLRLEAVGPGEEFPPTPPRRAFIEALPDETEEAEAEPQAPLAADAPEPVRALHEWREKLPELSGQEVGHYKLGPVLCRGRYGVVFRATDSHSGQTVALKLLSPQFPADNAELQRFAGVMKTLLPLRYDHLVTLIGVGKNAPITWIAREHVEGESLSRVIRRQAKDEEFDVELAVRVGLHAARAFMFTRQHRLRHGALTPANFLVRAADQVVKINGLMMSAAFEGSELAKAVFLGRSPAEVAYLSPEQATAGAFVDESADLYALGAVLYALLTGRPPFEGKTAEEVLNQIRAAPRVERPSKLNRDVPARLESVVMKLLAKLPENRYATPVEVLAELEPIAAELGVEE